MCGDEEETVSHFLGQCPAIAQIRGQYFQDYYLSINNINSTTNTIPPLSISQTAPWRTSPHRRAARTIILASHRRSLL